MSIDEVRAAFNSVGDAVERATEWHRSSVAQLNGPIGGLPTERDNLWMVFHICPLIALPGARNMFDARPERDHSNRLRTVTTHNTNCRPHYNGLVTEERGSSNDIRERLVVHRDYKIEAIWRAGGTHDPGKLIYASTNETFLNDWLSHFFDWSAKNAYPFPAVAFLTVLKAHGSCIHSAWHKYEATGDTLELNPAYLEDQAAVPADVMRATYDHLWQSYGYDECALYDEHGRFDKQRYNPRG
jgi:hypothetical protein